MIRDIWPITVMAISAVAVSFVVGATTRDASFSVPRQVAQAQPERSTPPVTFDEALDAVNRDLVAYGRLADRQPPQWLHIERVASLYVARAQLTGDHDDYLRAERELDRAFSVAVEGSGPLLSRAFLSYTLHRLPRVEPDLAQIERGVLVAPHVRREIAALRADVAFHSGRFEEAERGHRALEEEAPSARTAFSVAHVLWKTGRFEEAEEFLALASSRCGDDARSRSWMELQRGLLSLDRGRLGDALAHYRRADRFFPGHWLIEEHIAEIHALRGEHAEAERRYRALVDRTGDPEFMDALADVLEARGARVEAARLRAEATAAYERDLTRLPEAAYGHALGHFLQHGTSGRALELAQANFALRPGGEASVFLAQAFMRDGNLPAARERIEAILDSPFRTAELHATASVIYAASGDSMRADEQERLATAIHPRAIDDLSWLALGR